MNELDMRNILRLMSYPEWQSFNKFLKMLESQALGNLKKSDDEKTMFRGQGKLAVLDEIEQSSSRFKQRIIDNANA